MKKSYKAKSCLNFGKAKKKKDIRQRYCTRSWKWLKAFATKSLIGRLSLTPNDFEEHFHSLKIDYIREILTLKNIKQYENLDMSEEEIPTEIFKLWTWLLHW